MSETAFTHTPVPLPRSALRQMVRLVRSLHRLSRSPAYRTRIYPQVPQVARFDPGHDAVMMGYDFHLTPDGPRLIEVNTNAGGGLLAVQAAVPASQGDNALPKRLRAKLLESFAREFIAYSGGQRRQPTRLVIVDEDPASQFLYPEMRAFADLFRDRGVAAEVVAPEQLECSAAGVYLAGQRVDLVYNRHCDFYLQSEQLTGLQQAYLARAVCLTPNPHAYGLLGDKCRMVLWSNPGVLSDLGLSARERALYRSVIPETTLLRDLPADEVWAARKTWVFKPATCYGSKGVLLGEKISRKRFNELPPEETLLQMRVPPSVTEVPEYGPMKTDYRLFAYQQRILGVAARLYQGQVTNMRTIGGGFAPVQVV